MPMTETVERFVGLSDWLYALPSLTTTPSFTFRKTELLLHTPHIRVYPLLYNLAL